MSNVSKVPLWAILGSIGIAALTVIIFMTLFVISQPCDIDKTYFWCHTHPTTVFDYIGCVLMFVGCLYCIVYWLTRSREKNKNGTPAKDGGDNGFVNALGVILWIVGIVMMWL